MRNDLPRNGPLINESGVLNLDDKNGTGTHWVAYKKSGNTTVYFDSFGNLRPPKELVEYLGPNSNIFYNRERHQEYDTFVCGHLCLRFLCEQAL